MRRLFAFLAVLLLPASVALATEPSSGEVSPGSPKFAWTGSTTNSYPNYVAMNNNPEDTPCQTPTCDTFALKVSGGGVDLVIRARMDNDGSTGPANTGVRITKPDGSKVWTTGPSGETQEVKVTVKKAPAGDYVIDLANNFAGQPQTFSASAELLVPPPAAAPAPAPAPAPEPSPAPAPAPAPAETKLTVKPIKAKASKSRKLSAAITTSAPVTGVTATLARGGKKVAVAKAARIATSARMTIKSKKKLKPGKYLLTVVGTDAQGRRVTGQAPVTIRR
jgi:methionine-rich copper-binding protein CopC